MAVPTFRASGSWTVNTTSPLSATLPTHASGDLLLCEVHSSSSGTTISTHGVSGWTLVGSMASTSGTRRGRVSVYALKATSSSMTNPSATFSSTGTTYQNAVRAHSITAGTWNDTGTLSAAWEDLTTAEAADSSTLAFSGLVTTSSDSLCIASVRQCDDTATGITWSNSYVTQGTNLDSATGSDGFSSTGRLGVATPGGADTTATFTSGGSVSTMGVLFAVKQTSVRTGTLASLTGTGTLGAPTSSRAVSGTLASLTGAGTLGAPTSNRTSSGTLASLTGTGTLGDITGYPRETHSGTAVTLTGAGDYDTADGSKWAGGTLGNLTGTGAYSTADGAAGAAEVRDGTADELAGTGTLGASTGVKWEASGGVVRWPGWPRALWPKVRKKPKPPPDHRVGHAQTLKGSGAIYYRATGYRGLSGSAASIAGRAELGASFGGCLSVGAAVSMQAKLEASVAGFHVQRDEDEAIAAIMASVYSRRGYSPAIRRRQRPLVHHSGETAG